MPSPRSLAQSLQGFVKDSWQYRWKRPQWTPTSKSETKDEAGEFLVDHVSARVLLDEVRHLVGEEYGCEGYCFLLSVVLLSSRAPPSPADIVRVELECIPCNSNESVSGTLLMSRTLHWPESIITKSSIIDEGDEGELDEESQDETMSVFSFLTQRKPKRIKQKGLVSFALVRQTGPQQDVSNAARVLGLLSIGNNNFTDGYREVQANQPAEEKIDGDSALHLACLSSDGVIYFYDVICLLGPVESETKGNEVESFLLGDLFSRLQSSVRPLSKPIEVISLSIPIHGDKSDRNVSDHVDEPMDSHEQSFWDPLVWDSTIDPATIPFATRGNRYRLCIAAWEYIVVAGVGCRRRSPLGADVEESRHSRSASVTSVHSNISQTSSLDTFNTTRARETGGFVTFLATRPYTEVRTIYVPFAPQSLTPWLWNGEPFVLVLGETQAAAIRTDFSESVLDPGKAPGSQNVVQEQKDSEHRIRLRRFQMLPVCMPQFNTIAPKMFGSGAETSPSVDLLFYEASAVTVVRRKAVSIDVVPCRHLSSELSVDWAEYGATSDTNLAVIKSDHFSHDVATINLEDDGMCVSNAWCHSGPGYSLVGFSDRVFFVCWEGKILVHEMSRCDCTVTTISHILPLAAPNRSVTQLDGADMHFEGDNPSFEGLTLSRDEEIQPKDLVAEAILSITGTTSKGSQPERAAEAALCSQKIEKINSLRKANALFSLCPSWAKLEQFKEASNLFECQVPMTTVRIRSGMSGNSFCLTIRAKTNPSHDMSSFQSVLGWLVSQDDFFTATSLALALIDDQTTLTYLWRRFGMIESRSSLRALDHLVDGIEAIASEEKIRQLADMAVICMIRGGHAMASTLQKFLLRNSVYDGDACTVMLAATAVCTLSESEELVKSSMGSLYEENIPTIEDVLWPVESLLKACSVRGKEETGVLLIMASLPQQVRNERGAASVYSPEFSLGLCKSLVSRLIASGPNACAILLTSADSFPRREFWDSLSYDTQQHLSLMRVNQSHPFLLHPKTRAWLLGRLFECVEAENTADASKSDAKHTLRSEWLIDCFQACMVNAKCDFSRPLPSAELRVPNGKWEEFKKFIETNNTAREILMSKPGTGGLDFTIVIPCLLVLERRGQSWASHETVPTRTLLNAACYLAGRRTQEEPIFPVDGQSLMKACTVAHNVHAGASLIGGKYGLILDCCDILVSETEMNMESAEQFLMSGGEVETSTVALSKNATTFQLSEVHFQILSHLESHILSVRTYGEFEKSHERGHVDPVFAGDVCFRVWYCITAADAKDAAILLEDWLREKLEMDDVAMNGRSPFRLACAALTRSLIWSEEASADDSDGVKSLGNLLQLSHLFLVQLVQSCCGLVEAVPKELATRLAEQSAHDPSSSIERALVSPITPDLSFEESFVSAAASLPSSPLNSFAGV